MIVNNEHTNRMSLKTFHRLIDAQLANVNALISRAAGKRVIGLPVDVESGGRMETELLSALATRGIPDNRRFVNTSAEDKVTPFVPFQSKDGPFVLPKRRCQSPVGRPNSSISVIAPSC